MKLYLVANADESKMLRVYADNANEAAMKSGYTGEVDVYESVHPTELYVTTTVQPRKPAPPPLPKLTKPDRPSNVEGLKPTVELPDLGTIDDEDDLPF